jgi:hypothetical protein
MGSIQKNEAIFARLIEVKFIGMSRLLPLGLQHLPLELLDTKRRGYALSLQ